MNYMFLTKKNLLCFFVVITFYNCTHKSANEENQAGAGKSYYLNNNGNDANDGSQSNPWKTIDKLNSIQLHPGDTVCFEGGQTFN